MAMYANIHGRMNKQTLLLQQTQVCIPKQSL